MARLGRARAHRPVIGRAALTGPAGTTYALAAPSPASGAPLVASQDFTVTPVGAIAGTVTPNDSGGGGTFAPTSLTFSSSSTPQTFKYTPASSGVKTIACTNNNSLTDPGSVSYTAVRTVAADFFVDASGGSDSNAGTSSGAAWQTMTKANAGPSGGYIAGDTLSFKGGVTITGSLTWTTSGTQSARCVIGSYGTGNATVSCGTGSGVLVTDAEFVTVQNLTITGAGVSSSDGTTTSTGYAIRFYDDRTAGSKWRDVRVLSCTISGTKHGVVFNTLTPDLSPASVVGYEGITVYNCTVHDIQTDGIVTFGGKVWEQPPPYNNPADLGVFVGVYVGYCTLYNIFGSSGVYDRVMWLDNVSGGLAERNVCHDNGLRQSGVGDNAQIMWFSSDHGVTQFCEAYNNFNGSVFDIDINCTYCVLQYNYTHDNDGAGLMQYGANNVTTNVIRYNVSRNDTGSQDGASLRIQGSGEYYGNTIISDANVTSLPLVSIEGNAKFHNNLLVGNNGLRLFDLIGGTPSIVGNLYYTGSPSTANFDGSITTLAAWRAAGHETANGRTFGVIGNPLLSDPTNAGHFLPSSQVGTCAYFDIAAGSPARGAGVPPELVALTEGPVDFHGYPWRTGAAVDIGAVAYGASSLLPGQGTVPAAADVRLGTAVGATTGTLAVPSAAFVLSGISVDAGIGTYVAVSTSNVKTGVTYGAGSALTGTYTGNDRWSDVGIANVLLGVQYQVNSISNNRTGTLTLPTAAQCLTTATFGVGGNSITGTVVLPAASGVLSTVSYGPSSGTTGTYVVVAAGSVKISVIYGAASGQTGTYDGSDRWSDVGVGHVEAGFTYKANSLSNNRTGTLSVSGGTSTDPGVGNVVDGTSYTIDGTDLVGTFVVPVEADVLDGVSYGAGGTEFTGTATAGTIPTAVDIAAAVVAALEATAIPVNVVQVNDTDVGGSGTIDEPWGPS